MYNSPDGVYEPLEGQGPLVVAWLPLLLSDILLQNPSMTNYWDLGSNIL